MINEASPRFSAVGHRRVERAEELMAQTGESLAEIADRALRIKPRSRVRFGRSSASAQDGGGEIIFGPTVYVGAESTVVE